MLVYVTGHGAMDTMQHFILNDPQELTINIEERLRILAANSDTNVLAFYDICRSELSKFKGLD